MIIISKTANNVNKQLIENIYNLCIDFFTEILYNLFGFVYLSFHIVLLDIYCFKDVI